MKKVNKKSLIRMFDDIYVSVNDWYYYKSLGDEELEELIEDGEIDSIWSFAETICDDLWDAIETLEEYNKDYADFVSKIADGTEPENLMGVTSVCDNAMYCLENEEVPAREI